MITLIRGGWVVAHDGAGHRVVPGGEVAFEDARVIYAGERFEGTPDRIVEDRRWLVSPGFINLHGHIGVEIMAPLVDIPRHRRFAPSRAFVERAPLFLEPTLTPEEQRLSAEYSLVQMLKCGATTIVDAAGSGPVWWLGNPPDDEALLAETAGRLGARVYLALSYRSARAYAHADGSRDWWWDEAMGMAGLREAVRFCLDHRGGHGGRVQTLLCPHATDNCSPELLRATKEAAARYGLLIQLHTAQYAHEVRLIRERYGATPVEHLHRIGFLGPEVILGHCIYVSGHPAVGGEPYRDLALIAGSGASVAHSPLPFARTGEALHTLPRYLRAGVNVGIGCDIWPADIIREMHLAWIVGKVVGRDAVEPTARQVFDCATLGSARALQRDDLGRLAPGARADIVCVDLGRYHIGPVLDPIRALVTLAAGQDVASVWIDGQPVVEHGRVLAADEAALQAAVPAILEKLYAAASARDPNDITVEAILTEQ